jgi:hypothetical protein
MLTLLKHAYSTRLKSSKHAKMSAIILWTTACTILKKEIFLTSQGAHIEKLKETKHSH